MGDKKELKEMAKLFRESEDIIDELVNNEDPEEEDTLLGEFMVKMIKLQGMQNR